MEIHKYEGYMSTWIGYVILGCMTTSYQTLYALQEIGGKVRGTVTFLECGVPAMAVSKG